MLPITSSAGRISSYSQPVLLVTIVTRKMAYITGKFPRPKVEDQAYANGELNEFLSHDMADKVMETYINQSHLSLPSNDQSHLGCCKEKYSYYFSQPPKPLKSRQLKEMQQGNMDITKYYNALQTLLARKDMHYQVDWKDLKGITEFKRYLEKIRLYEFLAGLNKDLDEVRERILGVRPLCLYW